MNKIQKQLSEIFNFPKKYKMENKDCKILKNAIQLLVDSLGLISKLGLEEELAKE